MPKKVLDNGQLVALNTDSSPVFTNQYRSVTNDGVEYMVVSGVPVREQVMNTYLVPAEEIIRSLPGWNGTAISISHPTLNDGSVNVPAPDVAIIGRFYNAKWDSKKKRMIGEYWINIAEASRYMEGQVILNAIREGKTLETSTGYWSEDKPAVGVFGGKPYKSIHSNLLPDHIAILPNAVGACSIKDGCGVNQNAAKDECDCDCPFKNVAKNNVDMPGFEKDHLPTAMLVGYSFSKGVRMPEQLASLRAYIKAKGVTKPVMLMWKDDGEIKILDGNHRVSIADEEGIAQIPVVVYDQNLKKIDPEFMYTEWMHRQDQSYLNHSQVTKPALIKPKKESGMKLNDVLALLKGKGITVTANENGEEFEVEETPVAGSNDQPSLSAEEITALKSLASLAPKLNEQALESLGKMSSVIQMTKNYEAQQKAEKDSMIMAIKANQSNNFSDDELAGMDVSILTKMHAQMNVNYGPLAGAQALFQNEEVLMVPSPLTSIKPVEE